MGSYVILHSSVLTLLKNDPYKGESKYEVCQVKD